MAKRTQQRPPLPGLDSYFTLREAAAHLGIGEDKFYSILRKYQVPVLVLTDEENRELKRIRAVDLRNLLDSHMYGVVA